MSISSINNTPKTNRYTKLGTATGGIAAAGIFAGTSKDVINVIKKETAAGAINTASKLRIGGIYLGVSAACLAIGALVGKAVDAIVNKVKAKKAEKVAEETPYYDVNLKKAVKEYIKNTKHTKMSIDDIDRKPRQTMCSELTKKIVEERRLKDLAKENEVSCCDKHDLADSNPFVWEDTHTEVGD